MTSVRTLGREAVESSTNTVSEVSLCILGVIALVSGVWAFACLAGAIYSTGLAGLISGFLQAVGI